MFSAIVNKLKPFEAVKNDCLHQNVAHCYVFCSVDELLLDAFTEECVYTFLGGTNKSDALWRKVDGHNHADVLYFPRENKNFNKDEYETLMTEVGYAPIDGDKRVFILNHVENVLPVIQNRLLKLLEEPQEGYVFILKTASTAPLLSTVRSRSRVLELGALTQEDVEEGLKEVLRQEGTVADAETSRFAAQYADGNITKARDLAARTEYRGMCELAWDFLAHCDSSRDLLPYVDRLLSYEAKLEEAFGFFGDALRDVLAYLSVGEAAVVARDRVGTLKSISSRYSLTAVSSAIDRVQTALKRLAVYDNKTSVADNFLFGILEDKSRYPVKETK